MATTTTTKQRTVTQVFSALGKGYKTESPDRPVLQQFIYAICREGATPQAADSAYHALEERFFDWNEVRVSSNREIAEVLEDYVPDAEARAQRIIGLLQEVFETTFSFDLDGLIKKGTKQAAKQLSRYQAASDYAISWVVQQSMGGHAIPLDSHALRVIKRLGLIDEINGDLEALRGSLEHQVPKAKGLAFVDAISVVAEEHCWDPDPNCPTCPMSNHCAVGQEVKSVVSATSKKPR